MRAMSNSTRNMIIRKEKKSASPKRMSEKQQAIWNSWKIDSDTYKVSKKHNVSMDLVIGLVDRVKKGLLIER